jgi:hypothetical protein
MFESPALSVAVSRNDWSSVALGRDLLILVPMQILWRGGGDLGGGGGEVLDGSDFESNNEFGRPFSESGWVWSLGIN